ncbi:MAG: hypothetical protein OXK80_00755 [Bdellovibrionales bacterium]|nr:hypothetical protein [Bdellovibrionales bacterium]
MKYIWILGLLLFIQFSWSASKSICEDHPDPKACKIELEIAIRSMIIRHFAHQSALRHDFLSSEESPTSIMDYSEQTFSIDIILNQLCSEYYPPEQLEDCLSLFKTRSN